MKNDQAIKNQFSAALKMLKAAVEVCPDEHWKRLWYKVFHTLFFTDYYLSQNPKEFIPPDPFTESEFEDKLPERIYTKPELLLYLDYCKRKLEQLISDQTTDKWNQEWQNQSKTMTYSRLEITLYNIRHLQHHVGQLNHILKEKTGKSPDWIF